MFNRIANLPKNNSFFLFGARGTGKTTIVKAVFSEESSVRVDLLEPDTYEKFLLDPGLLAAELRALPSTIERVVIDEVQKLPALLDVVHLIHEERKGQGSPLQFILTGSSARKLKKSGTNLLAGRAHLINLFPLVVEEIGDQVTIDSILEWGSLPEVCSLKDSIEKARYLRTYVQTYLKEEIWDEHVVRKLAPFRKFLEIAAQMNGQVINYSAIARDVSVEVSTVQSYFQILEDTLLAIPLEPFHESIRKRQTQRLKYYFFDLGVTRALTQSLTIPLQPKTYTYGKAFEHFIVAEIFRLQAYKELDYRLSYLRTKDDLEIDLIIERPGKKRALIEIKSTDLVRQDDAKVLNSIAPDIQNSEAFCFSLDPSRKQFGLVEAFHWQEGLAAIGL